MNSLYYGFFLDLQNDVLEHWEQNGENVFQETLDGRNAFLAEPLATLSLADWAKDVLLHPNKCLLALGYQDGDYASYVSDKTRKGC